MSGEHSEDGEFLTPLQRAYLRRYPGAEVRSETEVLANTPPRSMGGCLGFLIVSMLVLSPLVGLLVLLSNQSIDLSEMAPDQRRVVTIAEWTYFGISTLITMFGGWCLAYRRKRSSVWIAIACLWVAGPALAISVSVLVGVDGTLTAARSIIPAIIWTLYLSLSKRFKEIYAIPNLNMRDVFE